MLLSALAVPLSRAKGFSNNECVYFIRDNRTYISIGIQILSTSLALSQTYVVTSLVRLATNAKLFSPNPRLKLDKLKLLKAVADKCIIFELGNKRISLLSLACVLLLQIPAALWAGSIAPTIRELKQDTHIKVPHFDRETSKFWATQCAPAQSCDELLGGTQDLGTFSFVNWKTRTGLLLNSVSQASSRNFSMPTYQKLDGMGFSYHGRSFGVGSAVGLLRPTYLDDPDAIVRQFSFLEDGYYANVSCQYNRSSQLSFAKSDMVTTPGGIYAPQGYWVHGSLPNGHWDGFPTWGVLNEDYISSIAAVNNQSRYMYGFLAGKAYSPLNQTQCEVWFTPSRFNVSADMDTKIISVRLSEEKPSDLDPTRALTNISFHGVGYLSQTLTTLYTSVLGDSFLRNIDNVQTRRGRKEATDEDVMEAVEVGLQLLLDHLLESSGAAQIMLLQNTKLMNGTMTIQVVHIGNFWSALGLLIIAFVIGAATIVVYFKHGLWGQISGNEEGDFLDFKSVILGAFKGSGSDIGPVRTWKGQSEDKETGELQVWASRDRSTLTLVCRPTDQCYELSETSG
ncbi:hypothetical protein KAF25_004146 [Fusarium avenaceum]|uniref:Uncharacterized protein n=1 Tax=Fusarium avenaceum TaxID=40199 RepID=A0A9P7H312_9HYPO|nr:hypothetical protein KAF25_004146 [Fusarium avenaceum]